MQTNLAGPRLLAVSDLHVSGFGDTLHDRARLIKRSARIADTSETRFATCWEEASWRVLRGRHKKREVVLVDPEGAEVTLVGTGAERERVLAGSGGVEASLAR